MKKYNLIILILLVFFTAHLKAQEQDNNYIEFNDRKNTVHGVYMGLGFHYGEINKAESYLFSFKIAYVVNQKFEVGLIIVGGHTSRDLKRSDMDPTHNTGAINGGYGGLHLEPILFSKSKLNLSFPLLIGGGAVADSSSTDTYGYDLQPIFVVEPGVSVLYNISRFIQFEAGIKYRLSSKLDFQNFNINNINGFSTGLGVKIGIFNMGRNRYKKNINDEN